jgi:hypothetical protein
VFRREFLASCVFLIAMLLAELASPLAVNRLLKFIETDGRYDTVTPWIWVALLFLGPTMAGIFLEWYNYYIVSKFVQVSVI